MTVLRHEDPPLLDQRKTPCLARLTARRVWQPTVAVSLGSRVVGIRANSVEAAQAVDEILADFRVPQHDPVARPNFSVELGAPIAPGRHGLNLVYRDHVVVARRREPAAVLRDLVELVHATALDQHTEQVAVRASAVVGDSGVTLVPPEWHTQLLLAQTRLAADGLEVLAPRVHVLDERTLELVRLASDKARGAHEDRRIGIRSWAVTMRSDTALTVAGAVHAAFHSVANTTARGPAPTLRSLVEVCAGVPVVGLAARPKAAHTSTTRELALTDGRGSGGKAS